MIFVVLVEKVFKFFLDFVFISKILRIKLLKEELLETRRFPAGIRYVQVPRQIVFRYLGHEIIKEVTCKRFAPCELYFLQVRAPQEHVVHALV